MIDILDMFSSFGPAVQEDSDFLLILKTPTTALISQSCLCSRVED